MAKKAVQLKINESVVLERPIEDVVRDSMLIYTECVVMDRAIPRIEDGLKPVQRRILYSMYNMNLKPDGPYKKCASVVGDCLGKYHPHGDTSVYEAMVRMAQSFSMRMPLTDGHGNFGSIEGDPPAAMRYTEIKLAEISLEMLRDIEKNTVRWNKNYDDSLDEPDTLPGRFPNLLVNGAYGIAVGYATNIPPHNLGEIIDGVVSMIDNPKISLRELMTYVKGPDFPTGGFVIAEDSLEKAYETGKGNVIMRARCDIETVEGDKQLIVIKEIPFMVDLGELMRKIDELKETKKEQFGGITDVIDESDRNGMRIVLKLKKGENPEKILNKLYKHTKLECPFNINMVAIADGRPQQLGLKDFLRYYIEYQRKVIQNRTQYDLNAANKRAHIVEGLLIAVPNIDEVIKIIRASTSRSDAKSKLRERFNLSDAQAEAILELKLAYLTKLEVTKLEKEIKELKETIKHCEWILSSNTNQKLVVKEEILELKKNFKSQRLSTIIDSAEKLSFIESDAKGDTDGYLIVGADNTVKALLPRSYYTAQRELADCKTEELAKINLFINKDYDALIMTNLGNCFRFKLSSLSDKRWGEKGDNLNALFSEAAENEYPVACFDFNPNDTEGSYTFITKQGSVKRTVISEFDVNKSSFQAIVLKDGDEVLNVEKTLSEDNITLFFATKYGMALNSLADDYPIQGRKATGVKGINLNAKDEVIFASQVDDEGEIVVFTDKGYSKRVILSAYFDPLKRACKGLKLIDLTGENGKKLVFVDYVKLPVDFALLGYEGFEAVNSEDIRLENRVSKGKPLVSFNLVSVLRHISNADKEEEVSTQ